MNCWCLETWDLFFKHLDLHKFKCPILDSVTNREGKNLKKSEVVPVTEGSLTSTNIY